MRLWDHHNSGIVIYSKRAKFFDLTSGHLREIQKGPKGRRLLSDIGLRCSQRNLLVTIYPTLDPEKSDAMPDDNGAAQVPGRGSSVAIKHCAAYQQYRTNLEPNLRRLDVLMIGSGGPFKRPFVTLAHELIHALHCLKGVRKPPKSNWRALVPDEEAFTIGLGDYARTEEFTENAIRHEHGFEPRTWFSQLGDCDGNDIQVSMNTLQRMSANLNPTNLSDEEEFEVLGEELDFN
jgi:hypothetical protein